MLIEFPMMHVPFEAKKARNPKSKVWNLAVDFKSMENDNKVKEFLKFMEKIEKHLKSALNVEASHHDQKVERVVPVLKQSNKRTRSKKKYPALISLKYNPEYVTFENMEGQELHHETIDFKNNFVRPIVELAYFWEFENKFYPMFYIVSCDVKLDQ